MGTKLFKQTLKNIVATWSKRLLDIAVVFVTVPIITRHFGLELMGVWLLATQLSQHIFLLEIGFNTSLTRFLSRFRAKNDLHTASTYLSTSITFLLAIGIGVVCLSPVVASVFKNIFELPTEIEKQTYWLVILVTALTGANLSLRAGIGMLSSRHQFDRIALWESMALIARLALVLYFFYFYSPNFVQLALITFLPTLFANGMLFLEGFKANRDLRFSVKMVNSEVTRTLVSISAAAFTITIAAVIVRQTSSMLAGWKMGFEEVANLAFPILIVFAMLPFISIGATLMSPIASQMDAENRQESFYNLYVITGRYAFSMVCLVVVGFFLLGDQLLELWLGGPKIDSGILNTIAFNVVIIFLGVAFAVPGLILRQILIAVGKHWNAAFGEIVGAIAGVMSGYILMVYTNLGTSGMAIGIAVAFLIRGAGFNTIQGAKYFSTSFAKITFDTMQKPIVVVLSSIFLSKVIVSALYSISEHSSSYTSISFAITCIIWLMGSWLFIIDTDHKKLLKAQIGLR